MLLFKFTKFTSSLFIIFMHLLCQSTAELAHGSNGIGASFKSGGDLVDAVSDLVNDANEGTISDDLAIDKMKKISVGVMCKDDAKFESRMDNFGKLRNDLCDQSKNGDENLEVFVENIVNIFTNNVLPTALSNAINQIENKLNDPNLQNIGTFRHNLKAAYQLIANNANIFNCHHHHNNKMMTITAKNRRRKRAKNDKNGDIEMGQSHNLGHDEDSSSGSGKGSDHDEDSSSGSGEGSGKGGKKCHCNMKWTLIILGILLVFAFILWLVRVGLDKNAIGNILPGN